MAAVRCRNFEEVEEVALDICKIVFHLQTIYFQGKRVMHKKEHKLKTSPVIKNPQFLSNLADIQAKLPTHEVVILTKFHKDCKKIVDFLLTQKFLVCALFYASPFSVGVSQGIASVLQP